MKEKTVFLEIELDRSCFRVFRVRKGAARRLGRRVEPGVFRTRLDDLLATAIRWIRQWD